MLLAMANMSQLKLRKLSVFGTVCSTRVTSVVWCCRIERHSRTGTGVTHLLDVQVPKEGTLLSSGAPQCRTLTNGLRSVDAKKKVIPSTEYGGTEHALLHSDMQIADAVNRLDCRSRSKRSPSNCLLHSLGLRRRIT